MLTSYPALEAYRRDVARLLGRPTFGADDGAWLAASMLLERYVGAAPPERRGLAPQLAAHLAMHGETTVLAAGLRFASALEDAGALHLAATWLTLLERLGGEARPIDRGRLLDRLARVTRKLGHADAALATYERVAQLGEQHAEPELTTRGWNGIAVLAHVRGNYPEARKWYRAAALVADDTGCIEQACVAHQGLLIVAAVGRDFERALIEGRRALAAAEDDAERLAEVLNNVAQVLHDMGLHTAALRGFGAVVKRTHSARLQLAALGGAALCAAALGHAPVVDAAAERIARIARTGWPYPHAVALLDLTDAFSLLGRTRVADAFRDEARELATVHGFFELVHRAGTPSSRKRAADSARPSLGPAAARMVSDFALLEAPLDLVAAEDQ